MASIAFSQAGRRRFESDRPLSCQGVTGRVSCGSDVPTLYFSNGYGYCCDARLFCQGVTIAPFVAGCGLPFGTELVTFASREHRVGPCRFAALKLLQIVGRVPTVWRRP